MRRTKIIATIGPASNKEDAIYSLLKSGVDVFRLNFSHGTSEEKVKIIRMIREASMALGRYVSIIGDIQGPKIRIGEVDGVVDLKSGSTFEITREAVVGNAERVSTPFEPLTREVQIGHRILINDGLVELVVTTVEPERVITRVIHGGPISSKKGMNFPDSELTIPAITEKDKADVAFAVEHQLDYIAASFVRRRSDIEELRELLRSLNASEIYVIAKLEKPQAIDNLEDILEVSDGVMVARGDLGVELPPEAVPVVQKHILRQSSRWGKFAITATQMLESMIHSPVPTRAEVGDVANAILDGTDAVMLSQETAMGEYPVEAVAMMAQVAEKTENHSTYRDLFRGTRASDESETVDAVGRAVVDATHATNAKAIVALSESGFTARMISRCRPTRPIIVLTPREETARQLTLSFACHSFVATSFEDLLDVVAESRHVILKQKLAAKGDHIIIAAGIPFGKVGGSNLMLVQTL